MTSTREIIFFAAFMLKGIWWCQSFTTSISSSRIPFSTKKNLLISVPNPHQCKLQRYESHESSTFLQMVDDNNFEDEREDPLKDGVDSVSWLAPLSSQSTTTSHTTEDAQVLPFFPLGGIVYTPHSEHVLNIFEPRYRKMYTDILMNGSKRFVVSMSHPEKEGTFAQTGVVFYLEDLKEVSEQTADQIKYICNHKVIGRAKLHRVLNPEDWETRDTYLKVEATILEEDIDEANLSGQKKDEETNDVYSALIGAAGMEAPQEAELKLSFRELVEKQYELEESVRFTRASVSALATSPGGGDESLWMTVRLWQNFIEQRLVASQNDMQKEFQEKLLDFLKKDKGVSDKEIPSTIGFGDLSPALQEEVQDLQKRMTQELRPLVLESTLTIQKVLEAKDHTARVLLLNYFMDAERKRLEAKQLLQGMFAGSSTAVTSTESEVKDDTTSISSVETPVPEEEGSATPQQQIIMDEDAFQ